MVDALERGYARDAAASTRLGHGDEIKHGLDAGVEQCHGTHETRFVRDEEGQSRQEVLSAILGRFVLCRGWLLGARICDLADDVESGVAEGMVGGDTRVVGQEWTRELSVAIGYRDVCDDGELGTISIHRGRRSDRLTSSWFWATVAYACLRQRMASDAQRTCAVVHGSGSHFRLGQKTVGQ